VMKCRIDLAFTYSYFENIEIPAFFICVVSEDQENISQSDR